MDSFHTVVLMIENNLEDKLCDSARKFQVMYLKHLHVYLHETSLTLTRDSHHHPSSIRHQSELIGKTEIHSQNFIKNQCHSLFLKVTGIWHVIFLLSLLESQDNRRGIMEWLG